MSCGVGNIFRLYLLQLIPIQSRYHQEVAKIDLLCSSFTQRFRGRITSFFSLAVALRGSYLEFVVTKSPSGIRKQKYGLRPETYPKMST